MLSSSILSFSNINNTLQKSVEVPFGVSSKKSQATPLSLEKDKNVFVKTIDPGKPSILFLLILYLWLKVEILI